MAGSARSLRGRSVLRSLAQGPGLSREDQAQIIESVLQLEVRAQNSEFEIIRNLSTDNIDFVALSRINGYFTLMNADYIQAAKVDQVIDYVVLRKIYSKYGSVFVSLSRVNEGRPCFGPAFSRVRSFTYEYRKDSGEWVGRLGGRTPRPFSAPWNWSEPPSRPM